ncbi:hypothetical protein [Sulfuritalea sp.]|uniref:hypothetical protein n=1 Tax=Sulfuritalea sp. TaxID=2480090 RepID=UPI00286E3A66|nr:hypothetical protein [Sulfuritalea sp.]
MQLLASHSHAFGEEAFRLSASLETWGYFNHQAPTRDSYLNPDNGVVRVAPEQFVADFRLNMRLSSDAVDMVLQPRFLGESQENGSGKRNRSETGFRQAFARLAFGDGATLVAGRNVMAWGPANFRSPSSPFYFDSGKLNPLREVVGIDLLRLEQVTGQYSFALGHVFNTPEQNGSAASHTSFLKIDYQGAAFLASANVAKRNSGKPFFGAFAQHNMSDALMLYAEYGYGQRAGGMAIDAAQSPSFRPHSFGESATSILLGASYTLLDGQVVSLESLHDRRGYSGAEQDMYFDLLKQSAYLATNAPDPALRGRSLGMLGLAAANSPSLLGRNYLSLLWQSNPQESAQYWRVATIFNVHDRSGQISGYYEKNLSSRFSGFISGVRNLGPADSEFRSVVEQVLTVGIKAYIF